MPFSPHSSALDRAEAALAAGRLGEAERAIRAVLAADPLNARAMRMLADLALCIGRPADAEALLRKALTLNPNFEGARFDLARLLIGANRLAEALPETERLVAQSPNDAGNANLHAAALMSTGATDAALALYERLTMGLPDHPAGWINRGDALRGAGRTDDAIASYRRALALAPGAAVAWWSLAGVKTRALGDADIAAMEKLLPGAAGEDAVLLGFALGKAYDDRGEADRAFAHYDAANRAARAMRPYRAPDVTDLVDRGIAALTPELLASPGGCDAHDPIFIIGMPRAGSTLVEQILASHSQVEGTAELPDIPALAGTVTPYPEALERLTGEQRRALGQAYLDRTRPHRRLGRARFIDKLPNNWLFAGLIRLILPNATIVDIRRDARACGWSNFKQHFARGQDFAYDLADIGRYYRDYVRMTAHLDATMPGAIHRLDYETLVADPEPAIRALLAACRLDFESGCLSPQDTARAVRTASAEQVRRPINRDGLAAWRAYEAYLGPLTHALSA